MNKKQEQLGEAMDLSGVEQFIREHPIDTTIFGVAVMLMLIFLRHDYRSLRRGTHNDMKGVIVSIGVLGTFIGIFLGLWDFDTSDIDGSVPKLLDGLKLAFSTSIAGMLLSIALSWIQRNAIVGGNDELSILNQINDRLDSLNRLDGILAEFKGLRAEVRDEQRQTRQVTETGLKAVTEALGSVAKDETLLNFRNEVHDEQRMARTFLEEQFGATNQSLKEAIDVLSKGATEEIIKALETVIRDFNQNLQDQFGDNFKQLNEAVVKLLEWQERFKEIVEQDYGLLVEIRESLNGTRGVLETIATRNDQFRQVYEQLSTLIRTYDTQLDSLNKQLGEYAKMGAKAVTAFEKLEHGFEKVQTGMGAQSEAIASMTKDIKEKLPDALGELEKTLVGLTTRFARDYQSFLENYQGLYSRANQ